MNTIEFMAKTYKEENKSVELKTIPEKHTEWTYHFLVAEGLNLRDSGVLFFPSALANQLFQIPAYVDLSTPTVIKFLKLELKRLMDKPLDREEQDQLKILHALKPEYFPLKDGVVETGLIFSRSFTHYEDIRAYHKESGYKEPHEDFKTEFTFYTRDQYCFFLIGAIDALIAIDEIIKRIGMIDIKE